MKRISTPTQQAVYRDVFALTAVEIDRISIGSPARVFLHVAAGHRCAAFGQLPQAEVPKPFPGGAAFRPLD
ncbi:hypothetical protein NL30_36665 [Burkholderia contaminans]|uniref:hypothetical protein n=1 Tax=Burkholderia contaminans TaxID=488447 RepID=UPI00064B615B|nr:hypothetical protein [Burkholderia contaminans]AKM45372.1 hypothetical protein NL30_36665 [Burkholderia contaminans]